MNNRREDRTHIEKGIPIYPMIMGTIAIIGSIVGITQWANSEHSDTNTRVAINETAITAIKETAERDRELQIRFYDSIETKVGNIEDLIRKRDDQVHNFLLELKNDHKGNKTKK